MKTLIVGGSPDQQKASGIVTKLVGEFDKLNIDCVGCNGYWATDISCNDLVIWMPDINNALDKKYPIKDKGAVMIVSKVIHGDRTEVDAVKRIFDFHANAVICIYKDDPSLFRFSLIDALGNTWISKTSDLQVLVHYIKMFYDWSKAQIRFGFAELPKDYRKTDSAMWCDNYETISLPAGLIDLNTRVADMVENSLGARYFGNFSTRCMKLFPSYRRRDCILVSPRNINKKRIGRKDCILVMPPYYLDPTGQGRKYSVDAPCQVALYNSFPEIKFMIHGHAEVYTRWAETEGKAATTREYYPCGDLREVPEIARLVTAGNRVINLRNHGFILLAHSLFEMEELINHCEFKINGMLGK